MKKYNLNEFSLILFLIMIFSLIVGFIKFENNQSYLMKKQEKMVQDCQNFKGEYSSENHRIHCEKVLYYATIERKIDYFYLQFQVEDFMPLISNNFVLILLVVLASTYYMAKTLKNNCLDNYLTRMDYKKFKKKILVTCYKPALVIPIFYIIKLMIYYLYSNNFNYTLSQTLWSEVLLESIPVFFIVYIMNAFLLSFIYCNISLIIVRKKHNFVIASVLSYLIIIGLELFLEIFFDGFLFPKVLHKDALMIFNIINFGAFSSDTIWGPVIVPLVIAIITFTIVIILYYDKEKLIIDSEAND